MDEDEKTIYESNEDPIKNKETIKLWLNEK